MMQLGSVGDGQQGRIEAMLPTGLAWSSDMLRDKDRDLTPHAFLVHQDPRVVLDRHYHDTAEFQVVVGGDGRLGTHEVMPFSIHYASSQAVYGPLVAGEAGLDYVTCRAVYQRGLFKFPEERKRMAGGRRSQHMGHVVRTDPHGLAAPAAAVVIDPTDDGLAAWSLRIPPGTEASAPATAWGLGRFLLLIGGSATVDGALLADLCVGWIGNREVAIAAGQDGAELIVLQLPAEAAKATA